MSGTRARPAGGRRRRTNGASGTNGANGTNAREAGRLVGGRYVLVERLGAGTSADVWRATDDATGEDVAVKLLHAWLLPDPVSRARFESEARSVERLRHPGIVAVRDVVLSDDEAAIVMDLVPGGTLAERLGRDGPLTTREAASIGADLAAALGEAHRMGVVHRDVKPGNVLLDVDGRPRLADFGIARSLHESQGLTVTGTVMGSLRYMAPEQLAGAAPTPAADVFALGAVLYEMLAGRPAFGATSPAALIEQQRHDPAPIEGVDPRLASVALAALHPDPRRRVSSAAALEASLRSWLRGGSVRADGHSSFGRWWPTTDVIEAPEAVSAGTAASAGLRARSRRAWPRQDRKSPGTRLVLTALMLALAVAGIAAEWNAFSSLGSAAGHGSLLGNANGESPSAQGATPGTSTTAPVTTPTPRATPKRAVTVIPAAPTPAPRPATHHKGHGHGHGSEGDSSQG